MPSGKYSDIGRAAQYGVSAHRWEAITPHNSTDFDLCDAIYVGDTSSGDVAVLVDEHDNAVTFSGLLEGQIYPIACKRVNSSSTTAASLIALYFG